VHTVSRSSVMTQPLPVSSPQVVHILQSSIYRRGHQAVSCRNAEIKVVLQHNNNIKYSQKAMIQSNQAVHRLARQQAIGSQQCVDVSCF